MRAIETTTICKLLTSPREPNTRLIVIVVFVSAFFTTFQGRLFGMSLPDIRGEFALDGREAAWLSTTMNAFQLLTMPVTVWLAGIFGNARVIITPSLILAVAATLIPFADSFEQLMTLHIVMGLCLGTYLPLTMSLALKNLKPQYWLLAMAVYGVRISFGTDAGVIVSGYYSDVLDWRLTYWTASVAGPAIAFLAWRALPLTIIDWKAFKTGDFGGMAMFCISLTLVATGLSLGEIEDWFNSSVVASCLSVGVVLLCFSLLHIGLNRKAFVDFRPLQNYNVRTALFIACLYTVLVAPTSILIPNFLASVDKLKPLQTGAATLVAFCAYLSAVPFAIWIARRLDTRLLLLLGLTVIVSVSAYCAAHISSLWGPEQFIPVLVAFGIGESLTLMGIFPIVVTSSNPALGPALGVYIPLVRIFAPAITAATVAFAIRLASDAHLVDLKAGLDTVRMPLMFGITNDIQVVNSQLLREASALSYIDGFIIVFWVGVACMLLAATLKPSPKNPLTPSLTRTD
jgi:MFS transporter, DHA2 family, multidrug resistance protein